MTDRFADLRKIPTDPARRLLALSGAKLGTAVASPAAAGVGPVLAELEAAGAWPDLLRLLSVALPAREAIWWGCIAADGFAGDPPPRTLNAARAWVFKPTTETREAARAAAEAADPDDETAALASAVAMHDGRLGTGDLAAHAAPQGVSAALVLGVVATALGRGPADGFAARRQRLIDSALDIARGGNGQVAPAGAPA